MYIGHRARFSMEFELTLDDDTLLTVDEQKMYRGWGRPADASGVPVVGEDDFEGDDVDNPEYMLADKCGRWARMHSGSQHVLA